MTMTLEAALPNDILIYLGRFLSLRTVQTFSLTCFDLWKFYSTLAQNELNRMQYPSPRATNAITVRNVIVVHLPLRTSTSLTSHWWTLAPDACRAIRSALESDPLTYYAEFDPCRVLLEENVLTARASDNSLASFVEVQDANRALILANQIVDNQIRLSAIRKLSKKLLQLPWETALGAIQKIHVIWIRNEALGELAMREDLPWKIALEIIRIISDEQMRDEALEELAMSEDLPWKIALEIIQIISDEQMRDEALGELAKRFPWKTALKIIQTISDKSTRDRSLTDLAKRKDLPWKTALKIILTISHKETKVNALRNLIKRKEIPLENAIEIIETVYRTSIKNLHPLDGSI